MGGKVEAVEHGLEPGGESWLVGARLADRFVVERRLGEGAMGVVFEARDEQRGEHVALKTLGRMDGASVYRLKQEFRALSEVVHPRLVRLHELFSDRGLWFFTMAQVRGVSFMQHVRGGGRAGGGDSSARTGEEPPVGALDETDLAVLGGLDEDQLRSALAELVDGVAAIHRAGKLHRDLKPANVLVDRQGHVTILDFGLAQPVVPDADRSAAVSAGTPACMAPEQLSDGGACPASDWYAVGVMMYEALTGRLPFDAGLHDLFAAKLTGRMPSHPRELAKNAPPDLADLAMALMRTRPEDRPDAQQLVEQLGAPPNSTTTRASPTSGAMRAATFLGRVDGLAKLRSAFDAMRGGEPSIVYVVGLSGIGKSALVERCLDDVRTEAGVAPVILSGRCYERESVPFKALDAVVDALSRHLGNIGSVAAAALMPRDTPELCRVFPVLGRVAVFAKTLPARPVNADAQEVRRRAFVALKELFARIADRQPLVVTIDDLHWGDVDSGLFLTQLLAPPDPPRMLLIGSYRSDEVERSALLKMLHADAARSTRERVTTIAIEPLGADVARELATQMLSSGNEELPLEIASAIAEEAGGSPFFIAELTRRARAHPGSEVGHLSLANVIAERVAELPADARTLLEVVAIAGGPVPRDVALRAAGLAVAADDAIPVLRSASLVRKTGVLPDDALETYHDRIRETIVAALSREQARDYHLALAEAFVACPDPPVDKLAVHYREGGRRDEARSYTLDAAARAAGAFAFDRAAALYRDALELTAEDESDARRDVATRLGEALGNAGRGAAAADAYLEAARRAPAATALDLERRAACELLACGEMDRGLDLARALSARLGIWFPRSPMVAQALGLAAIVFFYFAGSTTPKPRANRADPRALQRIDVGGSLALVLIWVEQPHAAYFGGVSLLRAMRAGDSVRLAELLLVACAGIAGVLRPGARRLSEWVEVQRRIGEEHDDPRLVARSAVSSGLVAFLEGRWTAARTACEEAELMLARCSGVAAETHEARAWHVWALFYLGDIRTLSARVPALANDARARGNLWVLNSMVSAFGPAAWLAGDDVETASREADEAFARWPVRGYPLQRYWHLLAHHFIELYAGAGAKLYARVEGEWPALRRSGLLFVHIIRNQMLHLRAAAALAAATEETDEKRSRKLLGAAERHARKLARNAVIGSVPLSALIRAGVACARGENDRAAHLLTSAATDFDAADMRMYAAAARRQLGRVRGGDEGAKLVDAADVLMRAEAIVRPDRFASMLAPGFPEA